MAENERSEPLPVEAAGAGALIEPDAEAELTLVELVNRVLDKGVVITGDVVISVAGVDLVYLGLDVMLTSVETARRRARGDSPPSG